jgi:hypothetical protein
VLGAEVDLLGVGVLKGLSSSPPNDSALSCEPQRLRGSPEVQTFDAKR